MIRPGRGFADTCTERLDDEHVLMPVNANVGSYLLRLLEDDLSSNGRKEGTEWSSEMRCFVIFLRDLLEGLEPEPAVQHSVSPRPNVVRPATKPSA